MHNFVYSSKDTFITNKKTFDDKNFGIDEILRLGTRSEPALVYSETKTHTYNNVYTSQQSFTDFTGTLTGSFSGFSVTASGSIAGDVNWFSASYFSGSVTASYSGYINGSPVSSSGIYSGSLLNFSGSISGSYINGYVTGSVSASIFSNFTGYVDNLTACTTGYIYGSDIRNEPNYRDISYKTVYRPLIKFDITHISESVAQGNITIPKFSLKMKTAREESLPISFNVYALPVSQSWEMGDGYVSDNGSLEGCSWLYKDYKSGSLWSNITSSQIYTPFDFIHAPESASQVFSNGGGTWYTSSVCSQSFNYVSSDINMDITPIVHQWLSGSIPNEGIIIIHGQELTTADTYGKMYYFSRDTNTIYSPYLDVQWDNSSFTTQSIQQSCTGSYTGSLSPADFTKENVVSISNLSDTYKFGDFPRVNIFCREKYVMKTFERSCQQRDYVIPKYLPTSSYYSIKDAFTEEVLVPFDIYSKLSCDGNSNYFYLDTTMLAQERYYKILIRTDISGSIYTFDTNALFRVVR